MSVARVFVEELFVQQGHERAAAIRLECQSDDRLAFRCRSPAPGEHQLLVRNYLAIHAANVMLLPIRRLHEPTVAAAGAHVGFDKQRLDLTWPHPALYFFRICPRGEDFLRRRVEPPLDGEAWFGDDGGHVSSSKKAASLSSR